MAEEKNVAPAEKQPKPKKEKKKGRIRDAWKGFKSEVKKVVWPSGKQVLKGTAVVLLIVAIGVLVLGGLDWTFNKGMEGLIGLFTDLFNK